MLINTLEAGSPHLSRRALIRPIRGTTTEIQMGYITWVLKRKKILTRMSGFSGVGFVLHGK